MNRLEAEKVKPTEEIEKNRRKKAEVYISQDGFVEAPVLRGFTEISNLFRDVSVRDGVICGGYVRYMCSPRPDPACASDVDIYSPTEAIFNRLKEHFIKYLDVSVETEVAVTYKRASFGDRYFPAPPIQLIKPIREGKIVANGDMEEILSNFDFTVIRCGLVTTSIALVDADFMHDEEKMVLRLKNIHCPISSTLRCMKYSKKGYWMPPMHALKLFLDWDKRDQDYRDKLIEFLKSANEGKGKDCPKKMWMN